MSFHPTTGSSTRKRQGPDDPEALEQRSKRSRTDSAEFNGNSVTFIPLTAQNLNSVPFNLPTSSAMAIDDEPNQNAWETREVTQANAAANAQNMGVQPFGNIPTVFQQNAPQPPLQPQPLMALFQPQNPPQIHVDAPQLDFTSFRGVDFNYTSYDIVKIRQTFEQMGIGLDKIEVYGVDPVTPFMMGCGYFEQKNYPKARACFMQGIGNYNLKEPELTLSHYLGLSSCFFHEGDYPMAIKHANLAKQFVSYNPASDGFYLFIVGCCYAKLNNPSSAITHFIQVEQNSEAFIPAQYNVGCLLFNQNNPKALDHFRVVKSHYPHLYWVT